MKKFQEQLGARLVQCKKGPGKRTFSKQNQEFFPSIFTFWQNFFQIWNMDSIDDFLWQRTTQFEVFLHAYQFWTKIPQNGYSDWQAVKFVWLKENEFENFWLDKLLFVFQNVFCLGFFSLSQFFCLLCIRVIKHAKNMYNQKINTNFWKKDFR